jgi:hypothetical protein
MRGRVGPLTPPALLFALFALSIFPGAARAHRLVVEYQVLPERKVQVEAWYSSPANPHPAAQAKVQVRRADGSTLAAGELDAKGFFTFDYERPEIMTIVVSQTGHREEVTIPAEKLGAAEPGTNPTEAPHGRSAGEHAHDHSVQEFVQQVLVGVGFLLALAAFVLSLRNARALRRMEGERRSSGTTTDTTGSQS